MPELKVKVLNRDGHTLLTSDAGRFVCLTYAAAYEEGDRICLEADRPGLFCEIRLDDTMLPALVYLAGKTADFFIPFAEKKLAYSPKSFAGNRHLIFVRIADPAEVSARRNLALNPYDQHGDPGFFPHASANIETRGESVFAARNVIDGIFAGASHGEYPYQSWGINRRPDAALTLSFGVPAEVDEARLTLRTDFPHDNYWTKATLSFSDGSRETLSLVKTHEPQVFRFAPRVVEWVTLSELIQSDEDSPFPALTQLELWGSLHV